MNSIYFTMMNEQVKSYFINLKFKEICQIIQETQQSCIYLEAVGDDIKLKIDEDDLKWVHYVRIQFLKQNPSNADFLPLPFRILATRYALLHPLPLHDYRIKKEGDILRIYESRRTGGGNKFEDHAITHVGDEMRKLYKMANSHSASDEEIAKWWIEENKNALHDYGKVEVPKAQVKILKKTPTSVDLAFRRDSRGKGAVYAWHKVENIGINMEKFRKRKSEEGYDERMHAGPILRYTKWKEILEPEKEGKGGKTANTKIPPPLGRKSHRGLSVIPVKHDHPGFIVPGKKERDYNPSEEFVKQYNQSSELKEYVEIALIKSTVSAITFMSANDKKGPIYLKIKYRPDTQHEVVIDKLYQDRGLTSHTVQNIMQEVRQRFIAKTGKVSEEDWKEWKQRFEEHPEGTKKGLRHWIYVRMIGAARSAAKEEGIGNFMSSSFIGQGSGDPKDSKGDGHQDGGSEELGAFAGAAKANVPKTAISTQINDEEKKEMQRTILSALQDPVLLRKNPEILQKIKTLAKEDPAVKDLLNAMDVDLENPYDDEDDDIFAKYDVQRVNAESSSPYSFKRFFALRLMETDVVWGKKKLKPGQTLKGGIQVWGAPWSAKMKR